MRTRKGLPFVCTQYMKTIIEGVMARVQRNEKVIICHFLWMGNHPHIIIVAKDSMQCTRFYGELKKQLTEAVKGLLGESDLSLWKKNGTSVIPYGDIEGVQKQIAYIYANPARAALTDTIERYPGLNTYQSFRETPHTLNGSHSKSCPWVRAPAIEKLPCRSVTPRQDRNITEGLLEASTRAHTLTLQPNAWMMCFDVSESEVEEINQGILEQLREHESEARKERSRKKKKVMGAKNLAAQSLTLSYKSKSITKKLFCYAADKETRVQMIADYKEFCARCAECYQKWKLGNYKVEWPPGAFLPYMPPRYNWLPE